MPDGRHQTFVLESKHRETVEGPGLHKGLRILHIFEKDCLYPRELLCGPGEQGKRPDYLQPDLSFVVIGLRTDEDMLVRFDPLRMISCDFFQKIEGALRDQPVFIVGEPREFPHEFRILLHELTHFVRLRDGASVAARQKETNIDWTRDQTQPRLFVARPPRRIYFFSSHIYGSSTRGGSRRVHTTWGPAQCWAALLFLLRCGTGGRRSTAVRWWRRSRGRHLRLAIEGKHEQHRRRVYLCVVRPDGGRRA